MARSKKDATIMTHGGRDAQASCGAVNMPLWRASTILFPKLSDLRKAQQSPTCHRLYYGRYGTPDIFAFEKLIGELEGGYRTRLTCSGLNGCVAVLQAFLAAGDHLLMSDSVYNPTRAFCRDILAPMQVQTSFYDPLIGGNIKELFRPNTRLLFMESPGSWTFEMQDVPAMAQAARAAGIVSVIDNSWATPLYFKPLQHGVDISIQSGTKYLGGHSDCFFGAVTSVRPVYDRIEKYWQLAGLYLAPDVAYLGARGLRSLGARLPQHWRNAEKIAEFLQARAEVAQIIYPALPGDAGHSIWKRDFTGASGLFAFILHEQYSSPKALAAMLDNMRLFSMGFSWGGYESLLLPIEPEKFRSARAWPYSGISKGQLMRIHVGLEDVQDLIDDLQQGLDRLRLASD